MIKSIFCSLDKDNQLSTAKRMCGICRTKQDFHLNCVKGAKKHKAHIICGSCYPLVTNFVNKIKGLSLFERISLF